MDKVPDWITQKAVNFVIKRLKNVDPNTKKKLATALQKEANEYTSANRYYDYNSLVERLETRIPSSMAQSASPSSQGYVTGEAYLSSQPTFVTSSPVSMGCGCGPSAGQTAFQYQTGAATPSAPAYYYETRRQVQTQQVPSSGYSYGSYIQTVPAVSGDSSRAQSRQFYSTSAQYPSYAFAQPYSTDQGGRSYSYSGRQSPNSWVSSQAPMFNSNTTPSSTPVQCPILSGTAAPTPEMGMPPVQWAYGQGAAVEPSRGQTHQHETQPMNWSDDERWAERSQSRIATSFDGATVFAVTGQTAAQPPRKLKGCLKKPREDVEFTVNHPNLPIGAKLPRNLHAA